MMVRHYGKASAENRAVVRYSGFCKVGKGLRKSNLSYFTLNDSTRYPQNILL
jgi:hypothetical protein